jgi:hypothetical protein
MSLYAAGGLLILDAREVSFCQTGESGVQKSESDFEGRMGGDIGGPGKEQSVAGVVAAGCGQVGGDLCQNSSAFGDSESAGTNDFSAEGGFEFRSE